MQKQQLKLRAKGFEQGYILLQMYEDKLVDLVASSPGLIKDLKNRRSESVQSNSFG